jgi:hypothetical protein
MICQYSSLSTIYRPLRQHSALPPYCLLAFVVTYIVSVWRWLRCAPSLLPAPSGAPLRLFAPAPHGLGVHENPVRHTLRRWHHALVRRPSKLLASVWWYRTGLVKAVEWASAVSVDNGTNSFMLSRHDGLRSVSLGPLFGHECSSLLHPGQGGVRESHSGTLVDAVRLLEQLLFTSAMQPPAP